LDTLRPDMAPAKFAILLPAGIHSCVGASSGAYLFVLPRLRGLTRRSEATVARVVTSEVGGWTCCEHSLRVRVMHGTRPNRVRPEGKSTVSR